MAGLQEGLFLLFSVSLTVGCISGTTTDASFQEELIARILSLEQKDIDQAGKMQNMEARLEDQEKTIHEYNQRVAELETTVAALQGSEDKSVSGDSQETTDGDGEDTRVRTQLESVVSLVNKEATKQKRVLVGDEGPVAFHAVIKKAYAINYIGVGQKIVFPDVMINLGGGYHNIHGIFIAPRAGVYLFSTSILCHSHHHIEVMVHLMKNGVILANVYAHGDSGRFDQGSVTVVTQGSVTVVTQLAAGDEVWVSLDYPADASLWGDYFDSFTGCLVVPV